MSAGPSWYDVLGVERSASREEIRTAWRAAIADVDPGDRRFRVCSQAAEVLLDPERRAAYDAELGVPAGEAPAPGADESPAPVVQDEDEDGAGDRSAEPDAGREAATPRRVVPAWLLAGLAILALVLTAVAAWVARTPSDQELADAATEAQAAAEQAAVAILAYDYRRLPESRAAAEAHLTDPYDEEYDRFFALIEENAPGVQAVVTAEVIASGVVRTDGEGERVQVLVFVDRPTTNAQGTDIYRDQVTMTMVREGEEWLVSRMVTTPTPE